MNFVLITTPHSLCHVSPPADNYLPASPYPKVFFVCMCDPLSLDIFFLPEALVGCHLFVQGQFINDCITEEKDTSSLNTY